MPHLEPRRAAEIIARFPDARLLIVGDLMVDRFIWGRVNRISPEAPVPVVLVDRETACPGGAGNVARNVVALGGQALPVGLRGDDADGETLTRLCGDSGIPTGGFVLAGGRPTTSKTRIVAHHQHVVRFDREERGGVERGLRAALVERALSLLVKANGLIVSDYEKGVITAELLDAILPEAARRGIPVVVDPKVRLFPRYRPATVVTPNTREALEAARGAAGTEEDLESAGRQLLALLGCAHLLITRGERGMLLLSAGGGSLSIPTVAREVFDVTGAGDTVAATLALALASGGTMAEGAVLANQAAGLVVGKLGTASVSREELLGALAGF